ncbi:MAG: RnfABCDGE type electron transport complex subunit D [Chitinophagaceae bacterium]
MLKIRDARNFQIIFLSIFLLYGCFYLSWDIDIVKYTAIFFAAFSTHTIAWYVLKLPLHSFKSTWITSLGLCLLLQTTSWWVAALAACIAIASKFIVSIQKKHFMNPATFGIISSILLTQSAWINPGQWGNGALLILIIGGLGMIVTSHVKRVDVALYFIISLFVLYFIRNVLYLHWPMDYVWLQFNSGSLFLFTFFMITDPMTSPNHPKARKYWAICIAILSFLLSTYFQVSIAPIWALFIMGFTTPLINRFITHERFIWNTAFFSSTLKK